MSPILKGTHCNLHPAPSCLLLSICLVFCSVTHSIPNRIILNREQLCSWWVKHVGCTRSNTQHRAGFSGAYALWVQVHRSVAKSWISQPVLLFFPQTTPSSPHPPQQTHSLIYPWSSGTGVINRVFKQFSVELYTTHQCHFIGYSYINKSISVNNYLRKREHSVQIIVEHKTKYKVF